MSELGELFRAIAERVDANNGVLDRDIISLIRTGDTTRKKKDKPAKIKKSEANQISQREIDRIARKIVKDAFYGN